MQKKKEREEKGKLLLPQSSNQRFTNTFLVMFCFILEYDGCHCFSITEREKEEERKKKEDEKRQKIEAEQNKNRKTAEAFVKFFVAKQVDNKSESNENDENMDIDQEPQMFMSFQVKEDMKIAPVTRRVLNSVERASLEHIISSESLSTRLYLSELKSNALVPRKASRTWQDDEDEKCSNGDDLFIIGKDNNFKSIFYLKNY